MKNVMLNASSYQSAGPPTELVEVLYSVPEQLAAAEDSERAVSFTVTWPGGKSSLLERMDYLTSIFPFELLDLREKKPNSSKDGIWMAKFKYDGSPKDRSRFEENFANLLLPRRSELVA